jgi:hypothetical protein
MQQGCACNKFNKANEFNKANAFNKVMPAPAQHLEQQQAQTT